MACVTLSLNNFCNSIEVYFHHRRDVNLLIVLRKKIENIKLTFIFDQKKIIIILKTNKRHGVWNKLKMKSHYSNYFFETKKQFYGVINSATKSKTQ